MLMEKFKIRISNGSLEILPPSGFSYEMLPIPPGSFMMGSDEQDAYNDEKSVHRVKIYYPFYLSKYPVTQALWLAVMGGENPSYFKGMNRPVEQVSWYDAAVFCNRLSELCKLPPVYFSDKHYLKPYGKKGVTYILPNEGEVFINQQAKGFRLPNEAEWEYAARASTSSAYKSFKYAGSNMLDEVGWYNDNSHHETKPVGLKMQNLFGLHDMSGIVYEWCNDHWHESYEGAPDDGSVWIDKKGVNCVLRGGGWNDDQLLCRVTSRDGDHPAFRFDDIGFRLVLVSLPV
jgi:sulfatase modifying factor 1